MNANAAHDDDADEIIMHKETQKRLKACDAKLKKCVGCTRMKSLILLNTRFMYPVITMNKI